MQHLLTPYSKSIESFAWWEKAFTKEELDSLQNKAKLATEEAKVGTGNNAVINSDVRRAEIKGLGNSSENKWIYEKLSSVVSSLNVQFFNFDLIGFGEDIQLTNYHENKQGNYTWHQDFGNGVSRKLSLVLQLSEPTEYEGGELQLLTNKTPIIMKKERGLITVFPAWTLHQVTPVVKGTRQSLVAWVSGPEFK